MTRLTDFNALRILVVGDVMLDRYIKGAVSRISPEAPVPVIKNQAVEDRLGGAANVAANLSALGVQASLLGIIGQDEQGESIEALCVQQQIHSSLLHSKRTPTITKTRLVSRQQQLLRLDIEEAHFETDQQQLVKLAMDQLGELDALIISDYGKGALPDPQPLIQAAKKLGKPVLVDPKGHDYSKYRGATLITPNYSEFALVAGDAQDDAELFKKGRVLRETLDLESLVITLSERGIAAVEAHEHYRLAAEAKEVFDVTGAGDTVIAVIGAALAAKYPLKQAITYANAAASVVVAKTGTATLSQSELEHALKLSAQKGADQPHGFSGVLKHTELLELRERLKTQNLALVMTNGCFDLLHPGHVAYLREARALGDVLLVAVNSDASVTRLKGTSRPINPLSTRLSMLAALESVDAVISFDSDTPEELIASVLPHVLVKGGDYEVEQIAGHRQVLAAGGEVKVLEFLPGFSSSELIERIKNS